MSNKQPRTLSPVHIVTSENRSNLLVHIFRVKFNNYFLQKYYFPLWLLWESFVIFEAYFFYERKSILQIARPKFFWWKISSKKKSTDIGIKISRSRRIFFLASHQMPWLHPTTTTTLPIIILKDLPVFSRTSSTLWGFATFCKNYKKNTHTHINSTFTNSWKKSSDASHSHLAVSQRFAYFRRN